MTGAVLRATSESGDVLDDPSEDALFTMFQDLEAGQGTFLIVESLADASGQTFVQAARGDDGTYVVEYRQGSADQHFQTDGPRLPRGARAGDDLGLRPSRAARARDLAPSRPLTRQVAIIRIMSRS